MEIGEVSCRIRAGQGAFIPPFTLHSFEQGIPNTCHVLMFSGELVTYFHQHCKTHIASTPLFTPSQESFTLAQVLLPDSVNDAAPLRAQAVLAPLCHEICTQCGFAPRALPPQDTFSRALDYIHTHFTEPLTAEQVARKVGLHPVTLSKGFRRVPVCPSILISTTCAVPMRRFCSKAAVALPPRRPLRQALEVSAASTAPSSPPTE